MTQGRQLAVCDAADPATGSAPSVVTSESLLAVAAAVAADAAGKTHMPVKTSTTK